MTVNAVFIVRPPCTDPEWNETYPEAVTVEFRVKTPQDIYQSIDYPNLTSFRDNFRADRDHFLET